MHNDETPCRCPKCAWIGMYRDAHEYRPMGADFNEMEAINVCPRCTDEVEVQTLGKKGLDGLHREHDLCTKMGYAHVPEKMERRAQIERIGQPLKQPSKTTTAFREMMLSGRMNQLMVEAVQDAKSQKDVP